MARTQLAVQLGETRAGRQGNQKPAVCQPGPVDERVGFAKRFGPGLVIRGVQLLADSSEGGKPEPGG